MFRKGKQIGRRGVRGKKGPLGLRGPENHTSRGEGAGRRRGAKKRICQDAQKRKAEKKDFSGARGGIAIQETKRRGIAPHEQAKAT